ncbi:hypothetical protein WN944_021793 [Citrus x changshan-huyou]|uniref:PGG domain-containing protein n=1 Tax=Citrus x changshan-huyou TaxID=2935761 RepID=A0AAP0N006_9ROSI
MSGSLRQKLKLVLWNNLMELAPSIKSIRDAKIIHEQTLEILRIMCAGAVDILNTHEEAQNVFKKPMFKAARLGIYEIVMGIMNSYFPWSLEFKNKDGYDIFKVAVEHRREKVFNIIFNFPNIYPFFLANIDEKGINILHIAARSVPSTEVPGAALQMQRELQWFKAVENFVHPTLQDQLNEEDFLVSLPRKLIIGLITLFFSIACLMVAFAATVHITQFHPWKWVIIPTALLGFLPVFLFATLQFPLLIEVFASTYGPDVAYGLLRKHPKLAWAEIAGTGKILELLSKRPKAFASGIRLGYWKGLLYQWIPVQEEYNPHAHAHSENVDGDLEKQLSETSHSAFGLYISHFYLNLYEHFMTYQMLFLFTPSYYHLMNNTSIAANKLIVYFCRFFAKKIKDCALEQPHGAR